MTETTDTLTMDSKGRWEVLTESGTVHRFDFDGRWPTVTRIPAPGHEIASSDREHELTLIECCSAGELGYWEMAGDPGLGGYAGYWHRSSPVLSITRVEG